MQTAGVNLDALWHDLECGDYREDLPLWRSLAAETGCPVLDVGAGTGRVTLDLAAEGVAVVALDIEPALLAALARRAGGLPVETVVADARRFELGRRFSLVLAPMQTLQMLGGDSGRAAFLRLALAHLQPGGLLAAAVADAMDCFDEEHPLPPPPDAREVAGVCYSSQLLAVVEDEAARRSTGGARSSSRMDTGRPRTSSSTWIACRPTRSRPRPPGWASSSNRTGRYPRPSGISARRASSCERRSAWPPHPPRTTRAHPRAGEHRRVCNPNAGGDGGDRHAHRIRGVYDRVEDAEADYELVKALHTDAGLIDAYDAAVDRAARGRQDEDRQEARDADAGRRRARRRVGLATGLVVALFPFAAVGGGLLLGTTAGGAMLGAVAGHAAAGMSRHDLKELGEHLDAGTAGLVVVAVSDMGAKVEEAMKRAEKLEQKQLKADITEIERDAEAASSE